MVYHVHPHRPKGTRILTNGPESNRLQDRLLRALLDAFPTRSALEQMLLYGLNIRLNELAAESLNLTDTAFEIIKYFDRRGQLRDLDRSCAGGRSGQSHAQGFC